MNPNGAVRAIDRLMRGEVVNVGPLLEWLVSDQVPGKYEPADVSTTVIEFVLSAGKDQPPADVLVSLVSLLRESPLPTLFALFSGVSLSSLVECDPVWLGPASLLDEQFALSDATDEPLASTLKSESFLVVVRPQRHGRLGAVLGLALIRAALGALYLVASNAGIRAAIGEIPVQSPAATVMIGPGDGRYSPLSVGRRIAAATELDLDVLLEGPDARGLLEDCVRPRSGDLVSQRLAQCAPWLQIGIDALADSDAFLALGIALEALVGNEGSGGETVDVVARRTGYLMREGATDDERALSGLTWANRTKRYYGERSSVAHARYEHKPEKVDAERRTREEFEALVCAVAPRFRAVGRARTWESFKDMKAWWDLVQMA